MITSHTMKGKTFLVPLLLIGPAAVVQSSILSFVRDSLDGYIKRTMKAWQVPGMAVVTVKAGQAVVSIRVRQRAGIQTSRNQRSG
ncbi:hypothetical protein GCM10023187_13820 [Nibrella viscosa]|uniref:Uncharacterized protein n=1 Tax=Nibrella viscosa TaxID=1084524 RepID=A0ABP8K4M4_9BACT